MATLLVFMVLIFHVVIIVKIIAVLRKDQSIKGVSRAVQYQLMI